MLRELQRPPRSEGVFVDCQRFSAADEGLFLWEAFVTGKAKPKRHAADGHINDAGAAVECFGGWMRNPTQENTVSAEYPLSLIGLALVWAGWNKRLGFLKEPCLVLKPAAKA